MAKRTVQKKTEEVQPDIEKEGFYIVYEGGEGEFVEKKSRFIATLRAVSSEEEAAAFINEMKKKYWDARHNCSAYVVGEHQELTRCSDDGEPAQTAGRPMLDVLLKERITNAAVVVTRYFGGVLLGTGGLVRAYQKAVQEGIAASKIVEKKRGALLDIAVDYNGAGKLQYYFAKQEIPIVSSQYDEKVRFTTAVPVSQKQKFAKEIVEQTNGMAKLEWGKEIWYFVQGDTAVVL